MTRRLGPHRSTARAQAEGEQSVLPRPRELGSSGKPDDQNAQNAEVLDRIFAEPKKRVDDFHFGRETALVFDDMLERSVPMYAEIQTMVARLASDFATDGSSIYDLGCSTCTSFVNIASRLPPERKVRFVGLDSSAEMLERGRQKLAEARFAHPFELELVDFNEGVRMEGASVALLVLTLQFVRPLHRDALLASIFRGMNENGCLILVEKILGESSTFNRLFIEHYYDFKRRNGYSDLEIAQKREALENVLVPYRLEENRELLKRTGFRNVDVFFKWFNFCGVVAQK